MPAWLPSYGDKDYNNTILGKPNKGLYSNDKKTQWNIIYCNIDFCMKIDDTLINSIYYLYFILCHSNYLKKILSSLSTDLFCQLIFSKTFEVQCFLNELAFRFDCPQLAYTKAKQI